MGGQLINAFLKSLMLESIGGGQLINAFLKSQMLESIGGGVQLINTFLNSRMLESIGGSTYKRALEAADVGIIRGGVNL